LKTLHAREQSTGRKAHHAGNTLEREKVATVSATQLSFFHPAIKLGKEGKNNHLHFSLRRIAKSVNLKRKRVRSDNN
jgi:hypothetical protein